MILTRQLRLAAFAERVNALANAFPGEAEFELVSKDLRAIAEAARGPAIFSAEGDFSSGKANLIGVLFRLTDLTSWLAERFAASAKEVTAELDEVQLRLDSERQRRTSVAAELQRGKARDADPSLWTAAPETELPEGLSQQLTALGEEFRALGRESLSLQRDMAANREERMALERRRQEVAATKLKYASQGTVFHLLDGLFGDDYKRIEAESEAIERLSAPLNAERERLARLADDLDRHKRRIAEAARQSTAVLVRNLETARREIERDARAVRGALRKIRWRLQINADLIAVALDFARACDALEEAAAELGDELDGELAGPIGECRSSLRKCGVACAPMLRLRAVCGSPKLLGVYRAVLSRQAAAIAERVEDCAGLLSALEAALVTVPLSEAWRAASKLASSAENPLAKLAEGVTGWLCGTDPSASERAGRALAALRPTPAALDEVAAFVRRHGGEDREEFVAAFLEATPGMKSDALRYAPRHSRAYRRAILNLGAELLEALEPVKASETNRYGRSDD